LAKDLYFCNPKFEEMSGTYTIPLSGLKEGRHLFDFEINNEFFELFEESEIKEGSLIANIVLDKRPTHLDLLTSISGSVRICCDRCLEMFSQPVDSTNRLLVKYGRDDDESDPDLLILQFDEHELDMSQNIYEYIYLALPIKRVHPNDERGNSTCDPEMLEKLKEHLVNEETETDPRWEELRKLMNDN
jgi:uncharacterized protein